MTVTTNDHRRIPRQTGTPLTRHGLTDATKSVPTKQATNLRNATRAGIPMPSAAGAARTAVRHGA